MIQFDTLDSTWWRRREDDESPPPALSDEQRMRAFVEGAAPAAYPSEMFTNASASFACDFKNNLDVNKTCPREKVDNQTLWIKGKDDATDIASNDVKQRRIGDCYFQSPVRALAATPEGRAHLKEMITEGTNEKGEPVYRVTFRLRNSFDEQAKGAGPWTTKTVEVSKDFIKGHAAVGDVGEGKQEVWPLVLEAGLAELKGSYHNIHGGWADAAFSLLTGKPAQVYLLGGQNSDISPIIDNVKSKTPMTVSFGDADDATRTPQGMLANHEYVVTGTVIKDHELCVKLENPWGYDDPQLVPVHELEKRHARVTVGQLP